MDSADETLLKEGLPAIEAFGNVLVAIGKLDQKSLEGSHQSNDEQAKD